VGGAELLEAIGLMVVSFVVLAKCADWLVDGAIDIAYHFKIPPILIGIVLVSLGTTVPELAVSVMAALEGQAAMALGNAVGSVLYDDGLALPLVALLAPAVVVIDRTVLRSAAIFLIIVDLLAYALCFDGTLARWEGAILVAGFFVYLGYAFWEHRSGSRKEGGDATSETAEPSGRSMNRVVFLLILGLAGVLVSSKLIVSSGPVIAVAMGVPSAVIALLFVALGTSIPEVATCVVAARRGQGSLAVGNILGADILNVCWIAGAAALVSEAGLVVEKDVIHFMFPAMLVIVFTMLGLLRMNYRFEKWKGAVLLVIFVGYLASALIFRPGAISQ